MPDISVVTVSYNAARTIERTIQSVAHYQDGVSLEYIIIDGGSTDRTLDIIERYETAIDFWISEPDNGIYDAMNKGISKATGEWIGIINSDDWYAPGALKQVLAHVAQNPTAGLVIGKVVYLDPNDKVGKVLPPPGVNLISTLESPNHPSMFVRRSVYEDIGAFDTEFRMAADYEFLARAIESQDVDIIPMNEIVAFMRPEGASHKHRWRGLWECCVIEWRHRGAARSARVLLEKTARTFRSTLFSTVLPRALQHRVRERIWRQRHGTIEITEERAESGDSGKR